MKALKTTLILPLLASVALAETETPVQQAETQQTPAPKQEIVDPSLMPYFSANCMTEIYPMLSANYVSKIRHKYTKFACIGKN